MDDELAVESAVVDLNITRKGHRKRALERAPTDLLIVRLPTGVHRPIHELTAVAGMVGLVQAEARFF